MFVHKPAQSSKPQQDAASPNGSAVDNHRPQSDVSPYPLLSVMLQLRGLQLLPQYKNSDAAKVFGCTTRTIQKRVSEEKWTARDLPGGGRFLPCDLEEILGRKRTAHKQDRLIAPSSEATNQRSSRFV